MFDGSRLPLEENIEKTAEMTALAHKAGSSAEGEIGFVGYADGDQSAGTDPNEAARFAQETGVDAMAISIGNVHLQKDSGNETLTSSAFRQFSPRPKSPLSSMAVLAYRPNNGDISQRVRRSASSTSAQNFARPSAGASAERWPATPELFDRLAILTSTEPDIEAATRAILQGLGASGQAPD